MKTKEIPLSLKDHFPENNLDRLLIVGMVAGLLGTGNMLANLNIKKEFYQQFHCPSRAQIAFADEVLNNYQKKITEAIKLGDSQALSDACSQDDPLLPFSMSTIAQENECFRLYHQRLWERHIPQSFIVGLLGLSSGLLFAFRRTE